MKAPESYPSPKCGGEERTMLDLDELKAAVTEAKRRVAEEPKGYKHTLQTAILATHGDALIAQAELAEADYEHQLLCRTTNSGDFVAATRRLNAAREANFQMRLAATKERRGS